MAHFLAFCRGQALSAATVSSGFALSQGAVAIEGLKIGSAVQTPVQKYWHDLLKHVKEGSLTPDMVSPSCSSTPFQAFLYQHTICPCNSQANACQGCQSYPLVHHTLCTMPDESRALYGARSCIRVANMRSQSKPYTYTRWWAGGRGVVQGGFAQAPGMM